MTKDQIDQLAAQLRGPVTLRILKSGWTWLGVFSLVLALLGVSYPTLRAKVEEMVTSQIAQRFAEPRIRETFQEVAEQQASDMLRNEIQPAVDRFRADLQKEYQALSEEVSRLRIQSNLPILSDLATSQGDREALEEIHRIAQTTPENSPLKKSALDLYINVLRSLSNQYYAGPFLTVTLGDDLVKTESEIPTSRLMTSLFDADWKVRARAAMLLGNRREKGVPDSLLHVARTDKNLGVVSNALISFEYVTRRIKQPRLAGAEIINLEKFVEMFDIDKLEQWWKEYSPEVNERLTEMK